MVSSLKTHLGLPGAMLSHSDKNSQLAERKYLSAITMGEKPSSGPPASTHPAPQRGCSALPQQTPRPHCFPRDPQTVSGYPCMCKVKSPTCINQLRLFSPVDTLSWLGLTNSRTCLSLDLSRRSYSSTFLHRELQKKGKLERKRNRTSRFYFNVNTSMSRIF